MAKLAVYAVWVPFLGGTRDAVALSQRVLSDHRVVQFWDENALTSDWFAQHVDHSQAPAWDVYYLYGPQARWTDAPAPLVSTGGTIIGQSSELKNAIGPLMAGASSP
jgi:hypothetical protein